MFLYVKSIFFNPSVGATVTAAGRNVISTSALTVELIGNGYRSYLVDAHLQIISIAKEESEYLNSKYTLPEVEVEVVLKHMLQDHYDTYYAKGFLRSILADLTPKELSTVYIKNNFRAFCVIPEVSDIIKQIYTENNKWRDDVSPKDLELEKAILHSFTRKETTDESKAKMSKCYMVKYAKHPIYGDLSKTLKKMSAELLMGFYFYSGDYIDGSYCETSVDIFENMARTKIPTADTDSNVSSVFDENLFLNEQFSEYTKDDEFVYEVATTVLATIIFTGSIDKSLDRYTKAVGVDKDYSHLIEMEEETTMYDLHLTTGKKKYVFSYFIQDGNYNKNVYESMKIRGLQVIKSDYNADICARVKKIFKERIMVKLDKLNYALIIEDAKKLTTFIGRMIRTDDYIINKSTVKKTNKSNEELAFGDARNKMSRLWKRFDIPGDVSFPGSFKELNVLFSEETLNMIEEKHPKIYKALVDQVKEIKLFEFYRSVINGARKFMNDEGKISQDGLRVKDKVLFDSVFKVAKGITKLDSDQLNEKFAKKISEELFDKTFTKSSTDLVRKAFSLGPKLVVWWDSELEDVDIPVTNDMITESIEKIGLPLDINEVPEFIKINDYDIIDKEFAATGEFLLGTLTDSMGISCPRNTSDKLLISSALRTY